MWVARFVWALAVWFLLIPHSAVAELLFNEIDYDQPGSDTAEYFELKNAGPLPASLSEYTVELVNGFGGGASVYNTISSMSGTLAVGAYFVVCADALATPNCDLQALPSSSAIQNGGPDAIGLRHLGVLVDAVSYEGITGAPYSEGMGAPGDDGLLADSGISRIPDGVDTDDNAVDFSSHLNTPGFSNSGAPATPVVGPLALFMLGTAVLCSGAGYLRRC